MVEEIPATVCQNTDGKASLNRDKSEDLPGKLIEAFGKKSRGSHIDSLLSTSRQYKTKIR
jgi:hypothetical protein